MKLSIIVALATEGAIGRGGNQPFFISQDLKRFKALTMGHPIIMGRKTFEALPKGPLPGRRNIVISSNPVFTAKGAEVVRSLDQAIALVASDDEAFIIGGGSIYRQALGKAHCIYATEIDADVPDADTFFPKIETAEWILLDNNEFTTDTKTHLRYRFCTYIRM